MSEDTAKKEEEGCAEMEQPSENPENKGPNEEPIGRHLPPNGENEQREAMREEGRRIMALYETLPPRFKEGTISRAFEMLIEEHKRAQKIIGKQGTELRELRSEQAIRVLEILKDETLKEILQGLERAMEHESFRNVEERLHRYSVELVEFIKDKLCKKCARKVSTGIDDTNFVRYLQDRGLFQVRPGNPYK